MWVTVHSRYHMTHFCFFREICTCKTSVLSFVFLLFCFLNVVFDIYIMWVLHSNKTWLSERFSCLSIYELVLLKYFLFFYVKVFIFLSDYLFHSYYHHYHDHFHYCCCNYYYFCHCHCHFYFTFNAFNFYQSSFNNSISYLCTYWILLNFKHDVAKHCSKFAIKTLRQY